MNRVPQFAQVAALLLAVWFSVPFAAAQSTQSSITGSVTDDTRGLVAGAQITVEEINKGLKIETTTDSEGNYVVPSLLPGTYRVTAQHPGFQRTVAGPLELHVSQRLAVPLRLAIGEVTQQIEVTTQGELVQSESSAIGQVVGSKMVVDLPLNGRNFLTLGLLSPGTTTKPAGSDGLGRGSISIAGGRTESNQFLIDGAFNGATAFNDLNVQLSLDAIQEFKIQRNTYNAEFGNGTGQINVATKTGTNSFHGTLFHFLRNDKLDARQFFDKGEPPPFRQNQFGGSFGGPVVKDRTFFFANYEGYRFRRGITLIGTLPSAKQLSGDFSGEAPIVDPLTRLPFADNRVPQNRFSALSQRILPFMPKPATGGAANVIREPSFQENSDQYTFRVDHRLTNKDSIYGRYTFYSDLNNRTPGLVDNTGLSVQNAPHNASFHWTRSFSPTLLNDVRFGFNREFYENLQDGAFETDILQFNNIVQDPINFGLPFVAMAGFSGFGTSPTTPQQRGSNVYQYGNDLTWISGGHVIKAGGGFRNFQQPHVPFLFGRGQYIFQGFASGNPVADFLLGNPFISLGAGQRPISFMSFHYFDGFVQDDWKVHSRLTLNMGLRYERVGTAHDRYRGRLPFFDARNGTIVRGNDVVTQGLNNPDNLGFQPRFGFAWQPLGKPNTVIRGGYGIYNSVKTINERNFSLGVELAWQQIVDAAPTTGMPPTVLWDNLFPAAPAGGSAGILTDDPFYRDPYSHMWSFGIQRELPFESVLEVTYAGQASHKLSTRLDINQARLAAFANEPLAARRPYPGLASILMSKNIADSNYNALQVRYEKRYTKGLMFLSAYTWSKSMDNASSTCDFTSCNAAQDNNNLAAEYGRSSFDQRQRLVMTSIYLLPVGRGQRYLSDAKGALNTLLGGWELSGIVTFGSGTPFPVQVSGSDRQQTGNFGGGKQFANCIGVGPLPSSERTVQRDFNTSAFQVAPLGTLGNCGRNVLTTRGLANWDMTLMKNTLLTEGLNLQFRAEFFNTFNRANFNSPVSDPLSPAFGRITSVKPAREIQFGLKLIF